jgi:hypothetical protein
MRSSDKLVNYTIGLLLRLNAIHTFAALTSEKKRFFLSHSGHILIRNDSEIVSVDFAIIRVLLNYSEIHD